jgi:hypothetical protein
VLSACLAAGTEIASRAISTLPRSYGELKVSREAAR